VGLHVNGPRRLGLPGRRRRERGRGIPRLAPMWVAVVLLSGIALVATLMAVRSARVARTSERARADADRRASDLEERSRRMQDEHRSMTLTLSTMRDGVMLIASDGRVLVANAAVERHLDGRPSSVQAVLPLGLREAARRATSERTPQSAEVETGHPARWLRGDAIPVGEAGEVLLVVRDVTEARRMDQVRRDFVANASHELKTPAASIQAAAETIGTAAAEDPAVVPRFAAQLEREAMRLTRIVSDLLDLSRLETGSELDEVVALDAVVRDEGERFEAAAREAGVELAIDVETPPRVTGSARDLALMVRNLLDNAIRYTRPGGRVDARLRQQDDAVTLTVSDTGVGIPTRDLSRIFERFYRVDRARSRDTGGTGLGLSIVKHVVENHGGTVEVRSELGVGSSFEVRLPTTR
jgi:signal transduction histidine kinase